jgi:hypothetical protein
LLGLAAAAQVNVPLKATRSYQFPMDITSSFTCSAVDSNESPEEKRRCQSMMHAYCLLHDAAPSPMHHQLYAFQWYICVSLEPCQVWRHISVEKSLSFLFSFAPTWKEWHSVMSQ